MGFDNECIVNIQSLAGEYFCPVCRLLVFPNEALQSQCTHLYCKPCLTYVVSTTKACPYDGYLVTEADSKPLTESNKTLAETIGKIAVHCLYHRSGCTWQGTLSECTSHCAGCAFGNSPVVCNRCGVQLVHRQVQEHAQNCPGVQGQVQQMAVTQDSLATGAVSSADQNQAAASVGAMASQALTSQTVATSTTPGQVSNQLPNPASQTQALVQPGVQPAAEQWYQQQQYQQYYQQYPGQDLYQQHYQHYYPYQESVVPQYQQAYGQSQPQSQSQSQPLPQSQPQAQPQTQSLNQHQSQPQLQPQPQTQGLSQPLSHIPAPVAPQSQNQMQVPQQPQLPQPAVQPHGQMSHPPGHGQALPQPQPQPYPYPQVQPHPVQQQQHMQMPPYQQPHPQMQHSQSQTQQPVQKYPAPQPQVHPQLQPGALVQHVSQPPMLPNQPVTHNVQSQVRKTPSHAVTGHHSYPQPLPHQNMLPGVPQQTMNMHPQSGPQPQPQPQPQQPAQIQNQFPQQFPTMRPNQSHAMFPNQQQSALLPPVQGQNTPSLQQQPLYNHNQRPGQINQRPVLHPTQRLPQQPFAHHQMPIPSHLRPQGFPKHAYPSLQGNNALSNSTHHNQSQNAAGRPSIPNHAGHIQPFAQSANTIPVRPGLMSENKNLLVGSNKPLSSDLQSRAPEPIERQGDVTEQSKNIKDLDSVSGSADRLKSENAETDLKPTEVGNKENSEDPHSAEPLGSNANAFENGDSLNKNLGKGESAESTWKPLSGNKSGGAVPGVQNDNNDHSAVEGNEIQDGAALKTETKLSDPETDKLRNDETSTPRPPGTENPAPSISHAAPFTDQGKHQQPMVNHGPTAVEQKSSAMLASQLPHLAVPNQPLSTGNSSNLLRTHGPPHALHSGQSLNSADNFHPTMFKQPQSLGAPGPYNQVHEPPFHPGASNLSRIGGPQFGAPLPGDVHGRMAANLPPHDPEGFGLQDERFKPFHLPSQQNIDRREYEDDLKKFPRPSLDAEPVSKFGNYLLGPLEAGKRPAGIHDDAIKKSGSTLHPGYLGPGPGYGRHHMDPMDPRSPVSEYAEMSSRRLGPHPGGLVSKLGIDDFDGGAARRFGEPVGLAFRDNRFPHLPSHLHRDEFDGFGNYRMGENPRSGDFIGQDEFAGHFRRGEHLGPHMLPRHLPLGEPIFGAHPGHMRSVELSGSREGFPSDAGFLTGDIRSFDNLRRRKASSMGWCRICKVDCETVDGLDIHSQTRDHQKMAMDIVKTIKQNAKKQKLIPNEQSSIKDRNKKRNTGFEGRGNKH